MNNDTVVVQDKETKIFSKAVFGTKETKFFSKAVFGTSVPETFTAFYASDRYVCFSTICGTYGSVGL